MLNKFFPIIKDDDFSFNFSRITSIHCLDSYLWLGSGDGYVYIYQVKEAVPKQPTVSSEKKKTNSNRQLETNPTRSKLKSVSSCLSNDLSMAKKHVAFSQSSLNLLSPAIIATNSPNFKRPTNFNNAELRVFNFKKSPLPSPLYPQVKSQFTLTSTTTTATKTTTSAVISGCSSRRSSSAFNLNEANKMDNLSMIRNYLMNVRGGELSGKSSMPDLNVPVTTSINNELPDNSNADVEFNNSSNSNTNNPQTDSSSVCSIRVNSATRFHKSDESSDYKTPSSSSNSYSDFSRRFNRRRSRSGCETVAKRKVRINIKDISFSYFKTIVKSSF